MAVFQLTSRPMLTKLWNARMIYFVFELDARCPAIGALQKIVAYFAEIDIRKQMMRHWVNSDMENGIRWLRSAGQSSRFKMLQLGGRLQAGVLSKRATFIFLVYFSVQIIMMNCKYIRHEWFAAEGCCLAYSVV